jgi:DNA polymerase-3 subunit alpha
MHAASMFSPDLGVGVNQGPLVLQMPEHRATTDTVTELAAVLGRHSGSTEVRLRLVKGDLARMFEIPMPVDVTADLFGELKSLLGPGCLV